MSSTLTVLGADKKNERPPAAPFSLSFVVSDYNGTNVSCNGASDGSIDMTITGGTFPFDILWSNGATTEDISGIGVGTYVVTVIDADLDTVVETVQINEPALLTVTTSSVDSVSCYGFSDGGINIDVLGGVGVYVFLWSNGSTDEDLVNIPAGSYTVTVTDDNGCIANLDTLVSQPDSIELGLITVDANAAPDGFASVNPIGGTQPYTYLWSNGATTDQNFNLLPGVYTVTVTDANNCTATDVAIINNSFGPCTIITDSVRNVSCVNLSDGAIYIDVFATIDPVTYEWSNGETTQDITGLIAGTYTVTITDLILCNDSVSFVITQPDSILIVFSADDETCDANNGTASAFPAGGSPGFTYLWSNSITSNTISGLDGGTYTITITDTQGCTGTDTVIIQTLPPPQIVIDSTTNPLCNGATTGAAYISIVDGNDPFDYLWSNGAITEDIIGVAGGAYTVTVTDDDLCVVSTSLDILQPTLLNDSVQVVNPSCGVNNGSITIFPYDGVGPYTLLWNTSQTSSTISNLAVGSYTVTITDANLCTRQRVVSIVNQTGPIAALDSVRSVKCFGGATGGVFISTTGGTIPITYLWSNSAITQNITNVIAGTYTVTVTDANLCTSTISGIVTQPLAALNDSVQVTNARCGLNNGSITVFPYNGTSPYTYLWSNSQTTQTISNLAPGSYTVTITDANLCTRLRTVSIINIAGPVAALDSVRSVKCFGGATGGVFISTTGGTVPLTYLWSNAAVSQNIINVIAGTYTVTVTDANLCTSTISGIVTQPLAALNDSVQVTNASCGVSNGAVTVFPYSGTSPYTYLWNNSQTSQTISNLNPATYTVTITDANLCTRLRSVSVTNSSGPVAVLDSVRSVKCFGGATGGVFISTTGGTIPITYLWSNSAITQNITNVIAGTYTVTVTDANLCTSTISGIVTQPLAALNDSVQVTNARCGLNNGSITVFPYNGTSPYTYLWSNSQTTQTISNLAPGSYTVTITDANLCTRLRTVSVINIAGPVAALDSVRSVKCFGGATGGVFISTTGGTAPLTYLWSNSAVSQNISNVIAGTYTVTVTDANLCTSVVSGIVTQPIALNDSVQVTNASCAVSNGAITIFPYNGTTPYTYLWSNSQTTQTITNLAPGSYTVTITDANLCTRLRTVSVINVSGPVASLDSVRSVRCFGGATGGVFISVVGGSNPITYLWSNSAVSQDITNVISGTYTVTVTDGNLCTSVVSGIVTQPLAALNDSVQVTNARCGLSNGSTTVFPYSGTSPYTYLWSNSQISQTISNLSPGSYTVTITDANLCTRLRTVSVINIAGPVAALDSVRSVKCFGGATGGVFISTTGGTAPLTYLWSNSAVSQNISNVIAGTYTVTVTDANLCTSVVSGVVTQPLAALNDSVQITNSTCGSTNGIISIFPYNGTAPYTYLWSNSQTTPTISLLAAGVYTVTVTDANLCTKIRVANVSNLGAPIISVDSVRNVRCFGGATGGVFISVNGGSLPYIYQWSNGASSQDINNVIAGNYTVTVTDFNNCQVIFDTTITQPLAALNDSVQVVNVGCGINNGSVTVFPYNGTSPYTYLWSNSQTSSTISNLALGTYTVTITDANLCTRIRVATVSAATGPIASIDSVRAVKCFGGATGGVFISVVGGVNPISYLWSNGAITQDITNVLAGTYTVTVSDANLCTATAIATVLQPAVALNDSVQVTNTSCGLLNGSITVFAYAGTAPYSLLWNTGQTTSTISGLASGTFTVTVTDANLCTRIRTATVTATSNPVAVIDSVRNVKCFGVATGAIYITVTGGANPISYLWSNSATTQDLVNVVFGNYTVTVSDANNCTASVNTIITQPTTILVDTVVVNAACGLATGSATAAPTGGVGPYTYLWNTGSVLPSITGVLSGTYTVTVTDANLCTRVKNAIIGNTGGPIIVIDSVRNVRCNGASTGGVFITVSGGTNPYIYSWSNSQSSQDIINLIAGTYTVTVTDFNNCTSTTSAIVTQPALLNDSIQKVNAACGSATGSATVFPFGGTSPYTLLWSTGSTSATITNLNPGNYTVTITDVLGCTRQDIASIISNGGPVATIDSIRNVKCFSQANGGIFISVVGGTSPLGYLWSNSSTSQDLIGVIAGTYTVTVTDANNCSAILSGVISQPAVLNDSISVNNATCGVANGSLQVIAFGGTIPYTYLWNTGQTSPNIFALNSGIYTVTVTDNNGCSIINQDTIANSGSPVLVLDSVKNVTCFGGNNGAVYTSISGGATPYSYSWSNSASTPDITGLIANTYTVTVTDINNCTATLSAMVTQPALLDDSVQITPEACNAGNGAITVFPYGGTSPYTYLWNNSATSQTITGLLSGNYTVTITDNKGCVKIQTAIVPVTGAPVITLDSTVNVSCKGGNNGAIYISVTGGSVPYFYAWSNSVASQDNINLVAGVYSVIVSDLLFCKDTAFFTITEPLLLQDSINVKDASCSLSNGSATIFPYGGTAPYSYLWSGGQTSGTINNQAPGIYTVTVTDFNLCTVSATISINQIPIHIITTDSIIATGCTGSTTGAIYISVNSGTPPYTYMWSNSANTQDITGLAGGNYTVTVTDNNNCSVSQIFNVGQSTTLSDSTEVFDATCGQINGTATIYPIGGALPYSYLWSTGSTSQTIFGLGSGVYTVTVTDANLCTLIQSVAVGDVGGPEITIDSVVDVSCNGGNNGAIFISVTSGVSPYLYSWSNSASTQDISGLISGTYSVTVTDQSNCQQFATYVVDQPDVLNDSAVVNSATCGAANGSITVYPFGGTATYTYVWNTGSTSQTLSGVGSGTYTVTITDANSCSQSSQYFVNSIAGPSIVVNSTTNVTCSGDSTGVIFVTASGGTLPYTFLWSNGSIVEDITNIPAGLYTVTVTDNYGCTAVTSSPISQPQAVTAIFTVTNANCNAANGELSVVVSGGIPSYGYLWNTGSTSSTISNLAAGVYTLTVTDQNSCVNVFNTFVNNIAAPTITVIDSGNVSCSGFADGFITVTVTGGATPYNYSWTNTAQTGNQLTNLPGNITYTLTITDNLGCIAIRPVLITEPQPIVLSTVVSQLNGVYNVSCFGSNDGSILTTVTGGVTPYSFLWSNFATAPNVGGLTAGNYTVTVTDANGCTASKSNTLTQPPLLVSNAGSNKVVCGIDSDTLHAVPPTIGSGYWIIVSGSGVFADSTNANTVVSNLANGVNVFQWVVTNGICSAFSQVVITFNTQIEAIAGSSKEICDNSILLGATDPQFGFGYWQTLNSTGDIADTSEAVTFVTGLNPGINSFSWTVINGTCRDSSELIIFVKDSSDCFEVLEMPTGFTPNEDGYNDVFFIKGLDDYPDNSLVIYNRWGNLVYEKSGYANDWKGVNQNGELLPDGTYFVIFKVRSINKILTNYVDIRR